MLDNTGLLDNIDRVLLESYQHEFPLVHEPFHHIGKQVGVGEEEVISRFQRLQREGYISRIGPILNHAKVGVSTLAAVSVAEEDIEDTAAMISAFKEVNHNYLREHKYNLWFVVTAKNQARLNEIVSEIEEKSGSTVLVLPMEKSFHINLGFKLWDSTQTN